MRQRSIMRQLSCYGFQNQFGRDQFDQVCEIYIVSRKLGAILLNQQEEKWQKEAMMWMKKDIFHVRSAYFFVAAAFLMSSEIY